MIPKDNPPNKNIVLKNLHYPYLFYILCMIISKSEVWWGPNCIVWCFYHFLLMVAYFLCCWWFLKWWASYLNIIRILMVYIEGAFLQKGLVYVSSGIQQTLLIGDHFGSLWGASLMKCLRFSSPCCRPKAHTQTLTILPTPRHACCRPHQELDCISASLGPGLACDLLWSTGGCRIDTASSVPQL